MNAIIAQIRAECERRGWAPAELARHAHIAQGTAQSILRQDNANPGIATLDKVQQTLGISVEVAASGASLVHANADVFSGLISKSEDVRRHEARVLEWDVQAGLRHIILPFFSIMLQTDEVYLYIGRRGCYNYSAMQTSPEDDVSDLLQIKKDREELLKGPRHASREIASAYEIRKFAEGLAEFADIDPKARRKQLDHVLEILNTRSLPGLDLRILDQPLYIMLGLYGDRLTIRGRGIYLDLANEQIASQFHQNFLELWDQAMEGKELLGFLEAQRDKIG
jgi:transcriptional regulator with XRE-family HTH domain